MELVTKKNNPCLSTILEELHQLNDKYYCQQNAIQGSKQVLEDHDELGDEEDTKDNAMWKNS